MSVFSGLYWLLMIQSGMKLSVKCTGEYGDEQGPVHTNFDGVDSVIFVFLQGFASDMCLLHMSLR